MRTQGQKAVAVVLLLAALALPAAAGGWGEMGSGGWWAWIWSWVAGKSGPEIHPSGATGEQNGSNVTGPEFDSWG